MRKKELMFLPFEVCYNNTHYPPHKEIGESGKVIWGLHDDIGFYQMELLK